MSQRSLKKWVEGSNYKGKCSQWADDVGWMSNHKKRKAKSESKKEQGQIITESV